MKVKKVFASQQFLIAMAILLLAVLIQLRSGQFFVANNLVDLLRACITPCTFAIGTYMVIISGGIDVSFPGVSALSAYIVLLMQLKVNLSGGNPVIGYLLCFLVGGAIGALSGFLIGHYRFPALIVTLGVSNIAWGILYGPLNNLTYPLPDGAMAWARTNLFSVKSSFTGGSTPIPALVLVVLGMIVLTSFIMNKTMLGRGIYAMGGNVDSASRVGFNVLALHIFVYAFAGGLAGIGGYNRLLLSKMLQTIDQSGYEMTIIAGVVLGGVRITGGMGTLSGALLGTIFLTILSNSLMMLGFSPYWANAVTGVVIILGISMTGIQKLLGKRHRTRKISPEYGKKEGV